MGNSVLIFMIKTHSSPHEPMYLFLCMLSVNDLMLCPTVPPTILSLFLFNGREIDYKAYPTQIFFIHSLSTLELGFLLAMAFDRYVAMCNPLRHSIILTHGVIVALSLAIVLRGVILLTPHPFLLMRLPYCKAYVIAHTYCECMALIKPACANTRIHRLYGLILAFLTGGLDCLLIICSYILIRHALFSLPSKEARLRTFSTCGSHVWVILVFYISAYFSFITHRFGPYIYIFIDNIYLLIPPVMNPIIYGVKTKSIWKRFLEVFTYILV